MKKLLFGLLVGLGLITSLNAFAAFHGCFVNGGCTGVGSVPQGSLLYGSSTNTSLNLLAPGSVGNVLWINPSTGLPDYTATSTLGISGGGGSSITLTTLGSGGAATLIGNVLNIPQYAGSASASGTPGDIQFANAANSFNGNDLFFWDNTNGRLGIGTNTPISPFVVIASTTGVTGLAVNSMGNGNFYVPLGNNRHDTLIGVGAGPINDYNPISGSYIFTAPYTSIGYLAGHNLIASTTAAGVPLPPFGGSGFEGPAAYADTSIGYEALMTATNTAETTAIGNAALKNFVGVSQGNDPYFPSKYISGNTAIGANALLHNINGGENTVIGNDAEADNFNGMGNTVIGFESLFTDSNNWNTAVGDLVGAWTVNTDSNALFGAKTLFFNNTTLHNTIIGAYAGFGNDITKTTASSSANVILGYQGAYALDNGSNNTLIGNNIGFSLSEGKNNTLIGNNIDIASTTSNVLSIDNLIYGSGLTQFTSTSTQVSAGVIGIGTTTPSAKLTIQASTTEANVLQVTASSGEPLITVVNSSTPSTGPTVMINENSKFFTGVSDGSLEVGNKNTGNNFIALIAQGGTAGVDTFTANGTYSVPATSTTDQVLASYSAHGYVNNSYSGGSNAYFSINAANNWTSGSLGTYFSFVNTQIGHSGKHESMRIIDNGNIGIDTTTPLATLVIQGTASSTPNFLIVASTTGQSILQVNAGAVGVNTSTPIADFQATDSGSNSTTTIEFGKSGQTKGSCLKLYRSDGSAVYAFVLAGNTTFSLSTSSTSCASLSGF